ncbi:MAG: hypothetical protein AB1298_07840, partial [Bacteroidota bacterium]
HIPVSPKNKLQSLLRSSFLFGLVLLSFSGCQEIPNNIIDSKTIDYKVVEITAPVNFNYSQTDSMVVTSVQIANVGTVEKVWCKVSAADGSLSISPQLNLYDDGDVVKNGDQKKGDGIFSGKFVMGKFTPNGKYQIEYFVEDNIRQSPENLAKVGSHIFTFSNNQTNLPPVISDLVIPGAVNRGESFIFTLKVDDPNGLSDIYQVYFKLFRPDGSQVLGAPGQDYILMYDNGVQNFGDQSAGDGIYSFKNSFSSTSQTGTWRFEFQAKDRGGNLSNVLIHNMIVN